MVGSHFIEKCREHGTVVRQCRCPDKNKQVVKVPCPGKSACEKGL